MKLFDSCIGASALLREKCVVLRKDKLPDFDWSCAVMLTLPYYVGDGDGTLAEFACRTDYHTVFAALETEVKEKLKNAGITANIKITADNSALDEVKCAALAGLGILGRNGMLITEKYSSYVFIGEMFSDLSLDDLRSLGITVADGCVLNHCEDCGRCAEACPTGAIGDKSKTCLSAVTQKKGNLTEAEEKLVSSCKCAWGCDICAKVCPYTEAAAANGSIITPYDAFKRGNITGISSKSLARMSDEEFSGRAFAWRGRRVIERNINLIDNKK